MNNFYQAGFAETPEEFNNDAVSELLSFAPPKAVLKDIKLANSIKRETERLGITMEELLAELRRRKK